MKKFAYLMLALLFAVTSCGDGGKYRIAVSFPDNSLDGKTAYLTSYDSGDTIAEAKIADACVAIEGETDSSFMARLIVDGNRLGLVVEKGEISIIWKDGKATGTPLNDKRNALNDEIEKLEKESEALQQRYEKGEIKEDEAEQLNDEVNKKISDAFFKAYQDNKSNGIGPWAFNYYLMYNDFTLAQIDSLVAEAPKHYQNLVRVKKAISNAKQLELTAVGKPFVDFKITTDEGKQVALADFVGKGKFTVVDFWASWCGPCRKEIESLKTIYPQVKDNVDFVGIAVWDNPADTKKAIQELQIPWTVVVPNEKIDQPTDIYGISGIPHIVIFDPQGVILSRGLQGEPLKAQILKCVPQQ